MKKSQKVLGVMLMALIGFSLACKKPANVKPDPDAGLTELQKLDKAVPLTKEGRNRIGMLIDGKLWLPADEPFGQPGVSADYAYSETYFALIGSYKPRNNEWEEFSIRLSDFKPTDTLLVIDKHATHPYDTANYANFEKLEPVYDGYFTDSIHTGFLRFSRLDTAIGIAAGTFEFDAVNKNGKVIHITNGRFDVAFSKPVPKSMNTTRGK